MVEKIFGLIFLIAAVFFAWKFTSMPSGHLANPKKNIFSTGTTPKESEIETDSENSPIVADIKSLLDQQVELVGLSENIQRISFKTHLDNKELNMAIAQSLRKIANQSANAPYFLEVEVFDMSGPETPTKKKSTAETLPGKVVFQFSVYDVRSMNKLGEFGATYTLSMISSELAEGSDAGKKKPDETSASSGSK